MKNIHEYLARTESATRKLYEGVNFSFEMLMNSIRKGSLCPEESEEEIQRKLKESDVAQHRFIYYESIAMDALCGALLQIAFMGIRLFSENTSDVPDNFSEIIKPSNDRKKPVRFCIGRDVRNVPIGLIIYAGRNSYNHFDDDGDLNKTCKAVFAKLCLSDEFGICRDPSFDLNRKEDKTRFTSNIMSLLGWSAYEPFSKDMIDMLK